LLFGNINTWLLWNLGGGLHMTDPSNASRTMLYNIHDMSWDGELLALFGIPVSMMPEVRPSSCVYGQSLPGFFGGPIKISGMAGDQQAALFGQACFEPGMVKNTYGTGCFLLMNTGRVPVESESGLLTTVAWQIGDRVEYALEGSVFTAGAAMQWLRDGLGIIGDAADSSGMVSSLNGNSGVYFVPAFTGLGAPYWDPYARGLIIGLTRDTSKADIIRAALESIAFQTHDVLRAMRADSGHELHTLRVDGGAASNDFLMGFQAGVIDADVLRPACVETTALGAAYLAGLSVGFWNGKEEIVASRPDPTVFRPALGREEREALLLGWNKAVGRALGWY
jgi:glycerol kinase